jgi:hypothetical protein
LKVKKNSKKSILSINERKQAVDVLECDIQALEYHSNLDKSRTASRN